MQETLAALLDQLVYIDNFLANPEPLNLDADTQLSLDLAAFADDSFIFADEDKPNQPFSDEDGDDAQNSHRDLEEGPSWLHRNQFIPGNLSDAKKMVSDHGNDGPGGHDNDFKHLDADGIEGTNRSDRNHLTDRIIGADRFDRIDRDRADRTDRTNRSNTPEGIDRPSYNLNKLSNSWLDKNRSPENHFNAYNVAEKGRSAKVTKLPRHVSPEAFNSPNPDSTPAKNEQTGASIPDLTNVPKFPVPPGAEMSLMQAGLSLNQIDLLSALIAQHQKTIQTSRLPYNEKKSSDQENVLSPHNSANHLSSLMQPIATDSRFVNPNAANIAKDGEDTFNSSSVKVESSAYVSGSEYSSGSVSGGQPALNSSTTALVDLDKRRRSLAASSRFRIKKKMKEKELEDQITQLSDMVRNFELKIDELELENRLLKNLIIEKGNQDSDEELKRLKERAKKRTELDDIQF